MRRLFKLMVSSGALFTAAEILHFASAMDAKKTCCQAAWLSNCHLSLLSQIDVWFPQGIAVLKMQVESTFIHFQAHGYVRIVSQIPPKAVFILGLLTKRMSHFVLLQGCAPTSSSSPPGRASSGNAPYMSGGSTKQKMPVPATCSSLEDLDAGSFGTVMQFVAPLPSAMSLSPLSRSFWHIYQQVDFLRLLHVSFQACSWNHACALHSA